MSSPSSPSRECFAAYCRRRRRHDRRFSACRTTIGSVAGVAAVALLLEGLSDVIALTLAPFDATLTERDVVGVGGGERFT